MTGSNCITCLHYLNERECKAFEVIPREILRGSKGHDKKHKNQKGDYIYTPIKPK